ELKAGSGTLHSLYGFTTIVADAGANWTLVSLPSLTGSVKFAGPGTIHGGVLSGPGSLNNSAALVANLNLGAVANYGAIDGTITSATGIDNHGTISAGITLTGAGIINNHLGAIIGGSVSATGANETLVNWGTITGSVSLSGHGDEVELIGTGTYAGGSF